MATVVNARDTQILATNPRYLGVTMNPNVTVNQSNVSGLGLALNGIKQIWLGFTTQVFQIAKSGTISPSSTTLTANVRNLTTSPTLSILSGTMSVVPSLTNGVFTYTPAQQTSDTITFRLSLEEDGVTYTDDLTIIKVREGSDAVTGLLTNENFSLPADSAGNVTNYAGCSGNFKIYLGALDVTSACTFSIVSGGNPDNLTVTLSASGASAGAYAVTAGYPVAKNSTTITMRAIFGTTVIDKVLSIAKARAGANGTSGVNSTSYWLSGLGAVQKSQSGVYTPSSLTISAISATGAGAPATYAGRFIIATTVDGTAYTTQYTSSADEASKVFVVPAGIKAIRVRLYLAGGTTNLLDEELAPIVVDGVQGIDGAGGVSAVLSNAAHVLPASNAGVVTSYTGSGTTLRVYEGATELTYDGVGTSNSTWTLATSATNITRGALTDSGSYATIGDHSGVASGTHTASITYTVSGKNSKGTTFSFPVQQSFTKAMAGGSGSNGQRGSRSFYVSVAATSWSDATATAAATVDGGPVLNDLVCQYNNAANFSQTRFWSGSSWIIVNAVVDGNLLVSGTVGAKAMTLNNGGGNNLWFDPSFYDATAWQVSNWGTFPVQGSITDGVSGGTTLRSQTNGSSSARGAWRVPVTVGKQYRVSAKARKSATANGSLYVRVDADGVRVGGYSEHLVGIENVFPGTTWTEFSGTWTATQPFASVMVLVNYAGTAGYMEAQDIRLEELTDSALIVQGGITADRIDSRGLSIKDATGNIILAAGSALNASYAAVGTLNSDLVPSITAAQNTANSAATAASNAQSAANSANAAITAIGSDSVLSKGEKPQVVQDWLTVANERAGIVGQANTYSVTTERDAYTVAHDALNTYLSGLSPAYNDTSQDTTINGASFRLYWVQLYDARQVLLNKIADEAGKRAVWANVGGSGRPADNATVGATFGLNINGQITSGNASTYIANAAIGAAQIGVINANQVNAASLSAITATIGTLRTATSGARTEIKDNVIEVFDSSNVLRVRMGVW